jgi:hypothetical protein
MEIMEKDRDFFDYIYNSNEALGQIQVLNLRKIQAFATNRLNILMLFKIKKHFKFFLLLFCVKKKFTRF